MIITDLYAVLGLTYQATNTQIKQAYRELAKRYHPDVSDDPKGAEKFVIITEAYEILSNTITRKRYDLTRFSPNPKTARGRSAKRYESHTYSTQQKAHRKAQYYSNVSYKKFDHEYFETYSAYLFPKLFSCLGMGIMGSIVFAIISFIVIVNELNPTIIMITGAFVFLSSAVGSTLFDNWHNRRQKEKVLNKE